MKHSELRVGKAVVFEPWNNTCVVLETTDSWFQRCMERRRGYGTVLVGWPGNINTVACHAENLQPCSDLEDAAKLEAEYLTRAEEARVK